MSIKIPSVRDLPAGAVCVELGRADTELWAGSALEVAGAQSKITLSVAAIYDNIVLSRISPLEVFLTS